MRKIIHKKAGFTLVEVLLAMTISIFVFAAMGMLMVKTLRLWGEGAGEWYLANQARAARARLLSGGIDPGPGTGLLSIESVDYIHTNPQWCEMEYNVAAQSEKYWIKGSVKDDAPDNKSIFIKNNHGGGQSWLTMVGIKRGSKNLPDVTASSFDVIQEGNLLDIVYTLQCEFGGRTYEYPQRVLVYLINVPQ